MVQKGKLRETFIYSAEKVTAGQQGKILDNSHLTDFQQTYSFWRNNYTWRTFPKPKVRVCVVNRKLENSGRRTSPS